MFGYVAAAAAAAAAAAGAGAGALHKHGRKHIAGHYVPVWPSSSLIFPAQTYRV